MNSETEKSLIARLDALEAELAELKEVNRHVNLPPNAIVGKDYVAALFGCSETAVLRGRCGTAGCKPVRFKPLGFVKSQVDFYHKEFTRTATQVMNDAVIEANKPKRGKSIITR